jgi:hypothetical protein
MTLAELNTKLDVALRAYIKKRKHILTGALYKSVMYNCTFENEALQLRFNSRYYVKFLEHGEFLNDFYNLDSTNEILTEFISGMIEELI